MKTILKAFYNLSKLFLKKKKPITKHQIPTHQISTKNKWLYPDDNFGKLERGVE